ncbi:MAG: glutathione ABC transporter ATP-binding protein, partial [Mycetocola sp.]
TSALDTSTQAGVVDLLAGLQRRLGFACLVISHDLALVQRLSDTVVVLRAGREVERGPAGILLSGATDPYTQQLIDAVPNMDPGAWAHNRGQRSAATEHA